ncbi:hypothetical protein OG875_14740 [Streptomyces sp. NBC_01498]|uniref:hypothetical protein n=1 Tax=Streptomyces sp. NBC_01498 TaxID=2975870 RepID=UPI002E7B0826|nr:hypothetical protein [Streptomyces sp. NBC_01498]WTL25746.1 hypothetical protein OG875_14740 [Streptomyces sp. NBC_01498]
MHVSLPAVPEQIQVARRIVRNEVAGLGWSPAKIAACEEVAAQLAGHVVGVVGVTGYYLGVTKRPGPEDDVAIRVSVTILDSPDAVLTVPKQNRTPGDMAAAGAVGSTVPVGPTGAAGPVGPMGEDEAAGPVEDERTLAEILSKRCGTKVNIVAQQGSWAASATLPATWRTH